MKRLIIIAAVAILAAVPSSALAEDAPPFGADDPIDIPYPDDTVGEVIEDPAGPAPVNVVGTAPVQVPVSVPGQQDARGNATIIVVVIVVPATRAAPRAVRAKLSHSALCSKLRKVKAGLSRFRAAKCQLPKVRRAKHV